MADVEVVIKIPEELYEAYKGISPKSGDAEVDMILQSITNGIPLTPDVLADLLMEERIRGELKQNITYSRDIVDNVECNLIVEIIDRRPCYCGSELREVWRESEG